MACPVTLADVRSVSIFFFFNRTPTPETYTLSLHDALPISDITGSAALNLRLSRARADAVRTYLARKGVAPPRMIARGYGPGNPVAPNTTPEGRALNRRVELHQLP